MKYKVDMTESYEVEASDREEAEMLVRLAVRKKTYVLKGEDSTDEVVFVGAHRSSTEVWPDGW